MEEVHPESWWWEARRLLDIWCKLYNGIPMQVTYRWRFTFLATTIKVLPGYRICPCLDRRKQWKVFSKLWLFAARMLWPSRQEYVSAL
ncbi:hypothetical protein ABIB48_001731 [Arthrobacter sp. UYCu511]